jgi:peroxiredoxin
MRRTCRALAATVVTLALCSLLEPARSAAAPVQIGDRIPNLTFKDIRYLSRSLNDFPKAKAFVIVFTDTSCPLVQRYLPVLAELERGYRAKDVQFLAVNIGSEDSITAMAAQALTLGIEFPFVKDFDGTTVKALGVRRLPEVVVLDGRRKLCYRGRIDDQFRLSGNRPEPTRRDLKEAVDAVLAGKDPEVTETTVDGCAITLPEPRQPEKGRTFAEHVAPIVQKHCQGCHRPGGSAPFALVTHKDVAGKANAIAEAIAEQRMPPWFANPEHGSFVNRRGLSDKERATFLGWLRSDKPAGDDSKLPPPRAFPEDKWLIGKPDLVVSMAQPHELPAKGDIPYKYAIFPYLFTEETWVQGVQIVPDNPRVLHHCNLAYLKLGESFNVANFITGNTPGGEPVMLEDGIAYRIPKGSIIGIQIHYVTTGKPEKCQISVGFRFPKVPVQKRLKFAMLANHRFAIPPGAPAHPVAASQRLDEDALGVGMFVHMHLRGKDATFNAHRPDGKTETLLQIPNYQFNWQMPYRWQPGKQRLTKDTRLECVAHFDNSPFNPYNPDPAATVREGLQTYQEMMYGFVFYVSASEKLGLNVDPKTGRVKPKEE